MNRSMLIALVKSYYDAQKIRIEVGNRICANTRTKLGQAAGEKDEDVDNSLKKLIFEYERIADVLTSDNVRAKVKAITNSAGVITDVFEFDLIGYYTALLESENRLLKTLSDSVKQFPIWNAFMSDVKGCGPLMAAVIISYIDIEKATYPSSIYRFAGLDVVPVTTQRDYDPGVDKMEDALPMYEDDGSEHFVVEETKYEGRSRKSAHLVEHTYKDKEGNEKKRRGISFNPFLKTKLIGVLGTSFIKCGGKYREIYDDYKNRLNNRIDTKDFTKAHKHNMAIRYAVKRFLADLYIAWRTLEGLEVHEEYAAAKLGIIHSKPNCVGATVMDIIKEKQEVGA